MKQKDPSILRQLLRILSKKQKRVLVLLIVLTIGSALLETGVVGMMLTFMNAVLDIDSLENSQWRSVIYRVFRCESVTDLLVVLALLLAALYVGKALYAMLINVLKAHAFTRIRTSLSVRLFDTVMKKPYRYHLQHNTAQLQRLVTTDVDRAFALVSNLIAAVSELCVSLGILALLFSVDVKLTLFALLLMAALLLFSNRVVTPPLRRAGRNEVLNTAAMMRWVQQAMGAVKGIYASRRQAFFINSYAEHARVTAESSATNTILSLVPKLVVETVCMGAVFVYMAAMVRQGGDLAYMLPTLATFALAATRLIPVANRITSSITEINYKRNSLRAIYTMLTEEGVSVEDDGMLLETQPVRPLAATLPLTEGVSIRHLAFHYEDAAENLYTDLSLELPAGKSVAFVGFTGSGKTTLADILLGLHRPDAGQVLADGHDIHAEPDWWADRVGYIPQAIYLCDASIRENVAFGFAPAEIDDARVWRCLEDACLAAFIRTLPQGLDTATGENGVRLSGGQRQRIGIARALYSDPQFLVMDEATSALDSDTEQAIIDSVSRLAGKKTLLIIAHRLTTIKDCDVVYRIEHGRALAEHVGR